MSAATVEAPRVLHALPGRVRLHVGRWALGEEQEIERALLAVPGVRTVDSNSLTGNILIQFDPEATAQSVIVAALREVMDRGIPAHAEERTAETALARPPRVLVERRDGRVRAHVAVRGLSRDPEVARRVADRLAQHPGVRARPGPLTGRVLVEFEEERAALEDVLAAITDVELPELAGEDHPTHPLDPGPLLQGAVRTIIAGLGLGFLAGRQGLGGAGPPLPGSAPAVAAGVLGAVQGFPATRGGMRQLLGRDTADLVMGSIGLITLAMAGSPLGLAVAGLEALRLLSEVQARRAAWRAYEARIEDASPAQPGAVIRLDAGERVPLAATVLEGTGTALGRDGLPVAARPGSTISAGARVQGGPLLVRLRGDAPFLPEPRPAPATPSLYERYHQALSPLALAYAAATAVATRSPARALAALLLVNPRVALIGAEAATTGAAARVLRAGVTVVGTRPQPSVRRPDILLVDGPRTLTDGLELVHVTPLREHLGAADAEALAAGVAAAAGSPWGAVFPMSAHAEAMDGAFDGAAASATIDGTIYTLGPASADDTFRLDVTRSARPHRHGVLLLALGQASSGEALALVELRPRLASGGTELVAACRQQGVALVLIGQGERGAARAVAERAGVALLEEGPAVGIVRAKQANGAVVAVLSDSAHSAAAFAASDVAIALTSGRSARFAAPADLLAPDLAAVAAIIDAGARRELALRDAVALSAVANIAGAGWGLQGRPGIEEASRIVYLAALAALTDGWARLRGGDRPRSTLLRLADPRPERWGRRPSGEVVRAMRSSERGLTTAQAAERHRSALPAATRHEWFTVTLDQLRTPINGILGGGAVLSLLLGAPLDAAIILTTIAAGAAVGAWQEQRAGEAAATLERLGAATAQVLRDGAVMTLPASEVVPGDILVLAPGDRVAADARLIAARYLEVDEAALTGESLPVRKAPDGGTASSRVVLEGSDVTVGTGRAVVIATGARTRIGATAAALALEETAQSPLGRRLSRLFEQVLPLTVVGGLVVFGAGLLRGESLLPQLTLGATVAIAAVPEGLPLLAGVGQAAVARRLAGKHALVRRLGAVEALGRVDVACTDKTGTLTQGKLDLTMLADMDQEVQLGDVPPDDVPSALRQVLRAAALASPHPDAADAAADATDVAVLARARNVGLIEELRVERTAEAPFDPVRAFHATAAAGRLAIKGAVEALADRCEWVRRGNVDRPLDARGREALQARAMALAGQGLRVLLVAEGGPSTPVAEPQGLVALGFLGLSDPLRPGVPAAVRRCREAGIRVVMLTGDHPATARVIARAAGVLEVGGEVLTGEALAELQNGELDRRLEQAAVIARVTPLDKLRIIESLQRQGHTVAMTGDGVNDAPALRLADVGVAMGRGGTEVARQAADVVLADDDFATLVEALVEGRSFWRNTRRALALLLGGNLGELGLVVGASLVGLAPPLLTRQILVVNLVTDALPALAVVAQRPASQNLAGLAREGTAAMDRPLRNDVIRRGALTAGPALVAYLAALASGSLPQARAVAFASVVATQLAQTVEAGQTEGGLTRPVLGAVAGSGGLLLATLTVPPLRDLLLLAAPTLPGWGLIGGATVATLALSRAVPTVTGGRAPGDPPTGRPSLRLLPEGPTG